MDSPVNCFFFLFLLPFLNVFRESDRPSEQGSVRSMLLIEHEELQSSLLYSYKL